MARRVLTAAATLGLSLLVTIAVAQEYAESTSVVVVEVPVNVVRDGEPVVGLTAEDFEITDEGKKQVISGFDVIDLREEASGETLRTMGVSARRHFVFVFDLSFSEPNAVARARGAAMDLVRSSLHPADLVAVATFSNRTGPRMILNFTTDRRQVEEAFSTLGLLREKRPVDDPLGIMVRQTEIGAELTPEAEAGGSGGASRAGLAPDQEIQDALERTQSSTSKADLRQRIDMFTQTFGYLAELLAPLEGRKHVVFLSEGFDATALFGTTDQERLTELQQAVELGQIWDVDTDERFGSTDALGGINNVLRLYKQADATIHSIDIAGLRTDGASPSARGRRDSLHLLASQTEGEFYQNYNDLSEAMGEMLDRTSVTYVLAFQPSDLRRKRSDFRRLKVKLKDAPRGTRLSYREGYYPPATFASLNEGQSNLRASQQMVGRTTTSGGIAVDVLATPFGTDSEHAYVPVMLQIPGSEIAKVPLEKDFPIELYAYAMDSEGEVKDYFAESLNFEVKKVGPALRENGLKYFGHLDLAPGEYALRVMVRDGRTGSTSVEVKPLVVPDFASLAVLPPLFPEGTSHWVTVRESDERAERRPVRYPFTFKGQGFVPAVRPVFEPEQVAAVSLMAAVPERGYLEVDTLLLAVDGTPIPGTFLRVLEREQVAPEGLERMIAAFEVPNLPGGDYQLVVTMSDPSSGEVESGLLDFTIGQQSASRAVFTPPDWMPDLSEIVGQLGSAQQGRKIVKVDREAARARYEDVLRQLASGRQMGAVLALAELEGGSLNPDNPMNSLAQISKVQLAVLEDLTKRDAELFLPAILLHKEAYSQYRLRKEPFLAVHARTTTMRLIELYAKAARSEEARRRASRILTGMAAEVYGSGAHISAQAMFDRATELDVRNGLASLGLGFMYENMGKGDNKTPKYEDAVKALERAVAVQPDLHEARLRLAVNLARLDRGWEGAKQLQILIDRDDVPPWILSLAYQELARLYVAQDAYPEARRVLERGVRKLPQDSKLSLQLAYVYERCQQQYQARNAAEHAAGATLSARFLYLQVPRLLEESAGAWSEAAVARLPALASALGSASTGVGR